MSLFAQPMRLKDFSVLFLWGKNHGLQWKYLPLKTTKIAYFWPPLKSWSIYNHDSILVLDEKVFKKVGHVGQMAKSLIFGQNFFQKSRPFWANGQKFDFCQICPGSAQNQLFAFFSLRVPFLDSSWGLQANKPKNDQKQWKIYVF